MLIVPNIDKISFWGRRDSGGSISSLFSKNSTRTKPDKPNNWSAHDLNNSSAYPRSRTTDYSPYIQSPSLPSRYSSTNSYSENYPLVRSPRRKYSENRVLVRNNHNYYSPVLDRKQDNYVSTNEKIDYKTLFEREKQEKEVKIQIYLISFSKKKFVPYSYSF